jgi:hypothetical protein
MTSNDGVWENWGLGIQLFIGDSLYLKDEKEPLMGFGKVR